MQANRLNIILLSWATFANGTFSITMSLTKDGKIAALSSDEE